MSLLGSNGKCSLFLELFNFFRRDLYVSEEFHHFSYISQCVYPLDLFFLWFPEQLAYPAPFFSLRMRAAFLRAWSRGCLDFVSYFYTLLKASLFFSEGHSQALPLLFWPLLFQELYSLVSPKVWHNWLSFPWNYYKVYLLQFVYYMGNLLYMFI